MKFKLYFFLALIIASCSSRDDGPVLENQEPDKLYGYMSKMGEGCEALEIYHIDIETGKILYKENDLRAPGCNSYNSSHFYRESNVFIHTYIEYRPHDQSFVKRAVIKDFDSEGWSNWVLENQIFTQRIFAVYNDKVYFSNRYFFNGSEVYDLWVENLNEPDNREIYEFPLEYGYDLKNSGFLPSTNELIFFTKDGAEQPLFFKVNVETSTLVSHNISDSYSSIFITTNERILGVKSLAEGEHEIVEIDKMSGNILSSLVVISTHEIQNIDYSPSSNSVYALIRNASLKQNLYRLNLNDGTSNIILLNEESEYSDFHGIYLND